MRKNVPVRHCREQNQFKGNRLISVTDAWFYSEYSDAFVAISGFTRQELIGQPHNIVRHPDMPSQAFEGDVGASQSRQTLDGLVKTRCKKW